MISLKEMSRDFNKRELYLMTISPSITSVKDLPDGTKITVAGTLKFEDVKDDGEVVNVLSIITPDNKVYTCQSATFKRSILDIAGIMDGEPFTVIKTSGKTRAGRDFVNCVLDTESVNI